MTSITSQVHRHHRLQSTVIGRVPLPGLCLLLLLTLAWLLPDATRAAEPNAPAGSLPVIAEIDSSSLPPDLDRLHFYLITVDVGDNVWDNFGHTALRVVDENSDTDLLFNWGLFDTSVGYLAFAANFMRGVMDYQLGVAPPAWELGRYQREGRTVWQDRINLSNAQKEVLYQRLVWNLREENIRYDYDYFFDNCTTRVRDYLDEALQGELSAASAGQVGRSFRDEVIDHYSSVPVVSLSLDVLMSGSVDRPMTQWQQMFLPLQLRQHLLGQPSSVYENGQRLNLLSDSQLLMQFTAPQRYPDAWYFAAALLLIPAVLLLLTLRHVSISSFNNSPGFTFRMPGFSYRLLGLLGLVISLVSGIYGATLLLGWLFSSHELLHRNWNLLLFWPSDLLGLFIAIPWLVKGRAVQLGARKHHLIVFYLLAHAVAAAAYLIIALSGLVEQRLGSVLIFLVPALLLFSLLTATAGLRPRRTMRFT